MTQPVDAPGRRDRKKARTRQAIADAALRLFLERGYDAVSVREVAEAAGVSVSGVWKHYSCKESLLLDRGGGTLGALLSCVEGPPPGAPLLHALRSALLAPPAREAVTAPAATTGGERTAVLALVERTPALRAHAEQVWREQETALASAVAARLPEGGDAPTGAAALARFVLDRAAAGPGAAGGPAAAWAVLEHGWRGASRRPGAARPAPAAPPAAPPTPQSAAQPEPAPQGLRERGRQRTRRAITDAAVELFLAHGYQRTGIRQVAEAADVSVSTVFAHFPEGKASLVFDEDAADRGAALAAAVRGRPGGSPPLRAVQELLLQRGPLALDPGPRMRRALDLVLATAELREHARGTWLRSRPALAAVLAEDAGLPADDPAAAVTARWLLEVPDLALSTAAPRRAVAVVVDLLESGWPAWVAAREPRAP
ncbi:hypothetical protein NUM3379_14490 [Kineococcus sp. NUM-3379]